MKLLAPFALLAAVLVAVIWADDTPAEADLVFVNQNEVFTLDPQRMSYVQDLRLSHVLYEGLLRWDNADFTTLPAAATIIERDDDGRRYVFRIRDDARWSNGAAVTAHDFVYAWSRAMLPDTASDYSGLFFAIEGATEFFRFRLEQTAAFVADPWSADAPDARADAVRRLGVRLRALLAAGADRPSTIAGPAPDTIPVITTELDRLEEAARTSRPGLTVDLNEATACQAWFERLAEPASRTAEAEWMWSEAERRFAETVGLRALEPLVLEVRLARPIAYFLDLVCFGVFAPVYRPNVEGWPEQTGAWWQSAAPPWPERAWVSLSSTTGRMEQKHSWAKPGRHIGNGTHVLAQWRYKRDLRLERNPYFHSPDQIRTDSVLALTIEDTNTAVLAFESGRVDWLVDVSTEYQSDMIAERTAYVERYAAEYDRARANGLNPDEALATLPPPAPGERRNIHVFPTFGTEFFSFNCRPRLANGKPNPFADAAVRRAFTLATNKDEIVDKVTRLHEPVLTSLIPPGSIDGYDPPEGLPFDPKRARAELGAAGWNDSDGDGLVENDAGERFPPVDLLYTTNLPRYKWMTLNLKSQWERELGVQVELRGVETKFYKEDLKQGKFMIARGRWYGDYGDPTTFLELCRKDNGNNDRAFSHPDVERLLEAADLETDPVKRFAMLRECEEIIVQQELPMLIICQLVQVYMYEPEYVHGLSDHPRLTQFLWQMQVDKP